MARVTVRMYATVREAAGASSVDEEARDMPELLRKLGDRFGRSVSELLAKLASDPESMVILINGRNLGPSRSLTSRLENGDEVAIFPPVSGG